MEFIKKGSTGAAVTELQNILRELDYNIPVTGIFDAETVKAVKNFQSSHLNKHNAPLTVDGEVGDLTWWSLQNPRTIVTTSVIDFKVMPNASFGGSSIGRSALQFAINELIAGSGEVGGNNKGPWVKKYLEPTGLPEGNSWCAAFISWCFLQAAGGNKSAMPFNYSAGARDVFNQYKRKGWTFDGTGDMQLQPGDIVSWWRVSMPSGFGHIGIVHHFEDGFIYTLEGNKAANVAGFSYVKTRLDKLLGYGRVQ